MPTTTIATSEAVGMKPRAGDREAGADRFTVYRGWAVLMAASTVVLDGLDNQMLGLAAPSLINDWGVARQSLGTVFALGFVGMGLGTLVAGWMGDRFGRRSALLFGALLFGVATLLTGFSTSLAEVTVLRFLAGVGLGGVPGTAAALIAEFSPARHRSLVVTAGAVCVSLGGLLGGALAAVVLPALGWRWLFYIGGAVPLVAAALLYALLPESPGFLERRPHRAGELARWRARTGDRGELGQPAEAGLLADAPPLLGASLRRDTLALCVAMLAGMFMIYLMFNWAPTLLFSRGLPPAATSSGLMAFNLGGTVGAILAAVAITRAGSRRVLVPLAIAGALVCCGLALLPTTGGQGPLLVLLVVLGLTASATQSAIFAVGTHAFPLAVRARGMGLMGAAGRVGALASAFGGAGLVAGGGGAFFGCLAMLMLVNAAGLAAVRRHVPGREGR